MVCVEVGGGGGRTGLVQRTDCEHNDIKTA